MRPIFEWRLRAVHAHAHPQAIQCILAYPDNHRANPIAGHNAIHDPFDRIMGEKHAEGQVGIAGAEVEETVNLGIS